MTNIQGANHKGHSRVFLAGIQELSNIDARQKPSGMTREAMYFNIYNLFSEEMV